MKILTLLRHAKSGWDDPVARDFDRGLNAKGRRAARTVGREMRALGLQFDAVIASPAVRVVETLREISEGYGRAIDADYGIDLYLASPSVLLDRVQGTDDAAARLLVVAHNPGLEQLALMLTGTDETGMVNDLAGKYPTATVTELRFEVEHWGEVKAGTGTMTRVFRPRDLDPELGPDA